MMNYGDEYWEWVTQHAGEDPVQLRLRYAGKFPWIADAINQVECRRRTAKKLPAELACPSFYFPTLLSAEQCTGDILADMHASLIPVGSRVLDMTCGLGIDVLHAAVSARHVTGIDIIPEVAEALTHNSAVLGRENVTAVCADCCEYLQANQDKKWDVIFIDPARRGESGQRIFRLADCHPDVTAMLPAMLSAASRIIVKASPMLDVTQTLRDLPGCSALYATGSATECKELIAVIDRDFAGEATLCSWTPARQFSFTMEQEAAASVTIGLPVAGGYLYEPNPTTMKMAPFKLLSQHFCLDKLSNNTHLYCSANTVDGFPGERMYIEKVLPYSSGNIKRLARDYPVISVGVRNFGVAADVLRKKLKVKDGGDRRLIATTTASGDKIMLILRQAAE